MSSNVNAPWSEEAPDGVEERPEVDQVMQYRISRDKVKSLGAPGETLHAAHRIPCARRECSETGPAAAEHVMGQIGASELIDSIAEAIEDAL